MRLWWLSEGGSGGWDGVGGVWACGSGRFAGECEGAAAADLWRTNSRNLRALLLERRWNRSRGFLQVNKMYMNCVHSWNRRWASFQEYVV